VESGATLVTAAIMVEEEKALRALVRDFCCEHNDESAVRAAMGTECGFDQSVWHKLVVDLALLDVATSPERMSMAAIVAEEFGRALYCGPWLSTAVLAYSTLLSTEGHPWSAALLARLRAADTIATVAFARTERGAVRPSVRAEVSGKRWRLTGTAPGVLDAAASAAVLVVADTDSGVRLFGVDLPSPGTTVTEQPTLDRTRRQADVAFADTEATVLTDVDETGMLLAGVLRKGRTLLAAEQLGGSEAVLELSLDYAKMRYQFGRPIGSFQAIKHKCVDMFIATEGARSLVDAAVEATMGHADSQEHQIAAAQSFCAEAFVDLCEDTIQILGGIGVTWEHTAHLYLKRARGSHALLGSPLQARARLQQLLGINVSRSAE
jgi:acyl-CoA dehydrogenase